LVYGIERYVYLARYEPANAANRTDPLIGGYDLATGAERRAVTRCDLLVGPLAANLHNSDGKTTCP
jgi:hypothetical protein